MTRPIESTPPASYAPTPSLIPSESAVHVRLVAVCREARLLRRLLRLCREAAADAASGPAAEGKEVGRVA